MGKVLIVYHTQSGNTEAMAKAVAEGAKSVAETQAVLKLALDTSLEDLLGCDAVAFGSAEYFGYMAGAMKDFFDRTFQPSQGKITEKPCVVFATGSGGGEKALTLLEGMSSTFKLKKVADGVAAAGEPSEGVIKECQELGKTLAQVVSQ